MANEFSAARVVAILDEWQHVPTMKLRAGEMSAQEVRTVIGILGAVKAEINRLPPVAGEAVAGAIDARGQEVFPSHQQMADRMANARRGFMCPLCGRDYPHPHSPEEITIYRNGMKWGRNNGNEPWTGEIHSSAAQDAGADAGAVGSSGWSGENEHLQHRTGQSDTQRAGVERDSGGSGVSGQGEVRKAAVAAPRAAPASPDAGAGELTACPRCGGSGEVMVMSDGGPDAYEVPVECPHCNGNQTLESAYGGVVKLLDRSENKYRECAAILYLGRANRKASDRITEIAEYIVKPGAQMDWARDRLLALADMAKVAAPASAPEAPEQQGVRKALAEALSLLENYEIRIEGEWGSGKSLAQMETEGTLPIEILNARAALTQAAPATGKVGEAASLVLAKSRLVAVGQNQTVQKLCSFSDLTQQDLRYLRATHHGVHYRDRDSYADEPPHESIATRLSQRGLFEWGNVKSGQLTFDPFDLLVQLAKLLATPAPTVQAETGEAS